MDCSRTTVIRFRAKFILQYQVHYYFIKMFSFNSFIPIAKLKKRSCTGLMLVTKTTNNFTLKWYYMLNGNE